MFCLGKGSFYSRAYMLIAVRPVHSSRFWGFKNIWNSALQIAATDVSIYLNANYSVADWRSCWTVKDPSCHA